MCLSVLTYFSYHVYYKEHKKYGIDKNRVYVSGFSMGGMMSYHAANKMGDMIAAIAPVSISNAFIENVSL